MIGRTISHYKILEKLGEGGMGVVYKAEDTKLRRSVALKFLTPELTRDKEAKSRFVQEAQAASALDHPNIAVVHEIDDTDDGRSFICMAYYDGKTLKDRIESGGPLDIHQSIRIAIQVAEGLQRAHEAGIVHRDIKPANIIITPRGEVKIVDFGVAKLSTHSRAGTSTTGGTAAYMSPEQAQGSDVDARSDLFSLGVVLYEMVTGKRPFVAEHEAALMYSIVNVDPVHPSSMRKELPRELEAIIMKLLEKSPLKRYQTAAELRKALKHMLRFTESTRVIALEPKAAVKNRRVLPIALVALIAVLLGFPASRAILERLLGLTAVPTEKRVAVLQFANIGGDPTNQAFCDGLMEIFTSKLTNLHVADASFLAISSADVRNAKVTSPGEAFQKLNATIAITGSVARDTDHVHIILNVVDAKTLAQIDSKSFEYQMAALTQMQNQAVTDLIAMLDVKPEEKVLNAALAGNTQDSWAYDYYILGRGYLKDYQTASKIDYAIQLFQRALKEDSTYALAHAALGEAYWRKYDVTKDRQWIEPAVTYGEKATRLENQLAPVHVTLGLIQKGTGNYEGAITALLRAVEIDSLSSESFRELADAYRRQGNPATAEWTYRKAIKRSPSYWAGYSDLGSFYHSQKRYSDAAEEFKRVIELAPDNPRGHSGLGASFFGMGRRAEAYEAFEKAVKVDTTYYAGFSNLATNYFYDKAYAEAARNYDKALRLNDRDYKVWGNYASALHWSGQREKAREKFQVAAQKAEDQLKVNVRDATVLSHLADYHSMLGNKSRALDYMKRSLALAPESVEIIRRSADVYEQVGQRDRALMQIESGLKKGLTAQELDRAPALGDLRKDARYQKLIEKWGKKP